mgnify:CR=1 FL=1
MAIHEIWPDVSLGNYLYSLSEQRLCSGYRCGRAVGLYQASVSRAMSILKKDGYVNVDADGAITLTETGLAIAKTMYTRHTVLSQMLMELGVDEETATEDACRIEHVISEKSFAAVQAHLEQVTKMREDAHGQ